MKRTIGAVLFGVAVVCAPAAHAATWTFDGLEVVDATVGTTTMPDLVSTSLAFDALGGPHVSYWRPDGSDLRYATRADGLWTATTLDSGYWGEAGWRSNLALDADGHPWIAYNQGGWYLNFLRFDGVGWSGGPVDPGIVGGGEASLALGADGVMRLSYYNIGMSGADDSWGLRYGAFTGAGFTPSEVVNDSLAYNGVNSSLALDRAGYPHIAYWHNNSYGPRDLRYSWQDAAGWHQAQLDGPGVGWYVDLALDAMDRPHIAYWDQTNNAVKYIVNDGTSWSTPQVLASNAGGNVSLTLDASGQPLVVFKSNGGLTLAHRSNVGWQVDTVFADESAVVGESADIAMDVDGSFGVTFYDETNGQILFGRLVSASAKCEKRQEKEAEKLVDLVAKCAKHPDKKHCEKKIAHGQAKCVEHLEKAGCGAHVCEM